MKWHKIEVDAEVFEYLKKAAEPFVDTPNSVLRRELKISSAQQKQCSEGNETATQESYPSGTPMALQQILDVIRLVKRGSYTRNEATQFVSNRRNVAPQTVQDKYGRQLGLTAYEFDRLLDKSRVSELETLLIRKFPNHGNIIRQILKD